MAETQQLNHSLQRQVEQLQQQLNQQSIKPPHPPPPSQAQPIGGRQLQERESRKQIPIQSPLQLDHKPHPYRVREMMINWEDGGNAPLKMNNRAAVLDGNMAYFMKRSCEVYSYNLKWSKLTKYPYCDSSLAVINGQLTAIGGCERINDIDTYTNKLLSLPGYKELFPAMPTKRREATTVTSKEHLVVAGGTIGCSGADTLNTVEVMDTKSLVWSTVASLPHPYRLTSGTILHGNQLYMLGGLDVKDTTKSVLTCSLIELLHSSPLSSSIIWHRVADAPAYHSTCATVDGELLAVGGCGKEYKPLSALHKYNPKINCWDFISNMPTARYKSLVAVLPANEMMVIGGNIKHFTATDKVEVAHLSLF